MAKNEGPQIPTDIPIYNLENIESLGLEWGPLLEFLSWYQVEDKIAELNKKLEKGEKPWRFPTKKELVHEFENHRVFSVNDYSSYLSSTLDDVIRGEVYCVHMNDGFAVGVDRNNKGLRTRLVR